MNKHTDSQQAPWSVRRRSSAHRPFCGLALVAGLFLWCAADSAWAAEYRAVWVDTWGAGILSQSQVDTLLGVPGTDSGGQLRAANCNAVFIEVRRNCDACYPSSMGEPYMSGLSPANFNALQAVINAAHDTTDGKKRIEVHCWIVTFRTSGGAVYSQHDDPPTGSLTTLDNYWPSRDDIGDEVSDKAFDPGHPLALQYTVNVAMDLVNHFDIDGIHFDYVRFTANNQGYNPTSIARYNARYGLTGQPAPTDPLFQQWRRDQVTALVRQIYARIQKSKPWVKESGAFVTWNPSPTSSTRAAFQATRPYYDVYSDWDSWLQEGIVDMAVPMTYYDWGGSYQADYTRWMNFEKDRHGNRLMVIGPGIYLNSLDNAINELQMTRDASPAGNYADGFCGYSYRVPYSGGTWAGFSPTFTAQVTPTWEDVPDMPWKSAPTQGHIMGTVTDGETGAWADFATVSITGPVNRTMEVDGTGFYAFIDVPPGTYTVTASKAGYSSAQATVNVALGAVTGNMYEQNLALGLTSPGTVTLTATASPGGAVTKNPDQPTYTTNTTVTLTATPDTGFAFIDWSGDAAGTANPLTVTLTSNMVVAANFVSTVTDVILDNTNPAVAFTGTWQTGTSSKDRCGSDYRFALTVSGGQSNVTYRPYIYTPGYYDVFIWYPEGNNRSITAPWSIVYQGGSTNISVNQRINGGAWFRIASALPFAQGTDGYVRLSNNTANPTVVVADAVRFLYVAALPTPPSITAQPEDRIVKATSNVTFSVTAAGTLPLSYQWTLKGGAIPGATANTFTRNSVQASDAGAYQVLITNSAGSVTSAVATLTVLPLQPPVITTQPHSLAAAPGGSATFTVAASSPSPLRYQWRFNSSDLLNQTNASLTLTSVQAGNLGSYAALVSNDDGVVLSEAATLSLAAQPGILSPAFDHTAFLFTVTTELGPTYTVEYKDDFSAPQWQVLTNFAGSGAPVTITDPAPADPMRFYRVHVQ